MLIILYFLCFCFYAITAPCNKPVLFDNRLFPYAFFKSLIACAIIDQFNLASAELWTLPGFRSSPARSGWDPGGWRRSGTWRESAASSPWSAATSSCYHRYPAGSGVENFKVLKYFLSVATPAFLCHKETVQGSRSPRLGAFLAFCWFFIAQGIVGFLVR